MNTTQSKQQQLDSLAEDILTKGVGRHLSVQATQMVFGEGNPDAGIVFIGEAPGKQEDLQGKPFVGASGRMLSEMLQSVGLERQDVYITNIVKYRPPENRDPTAEEKAAFLPYLQAQLDIIQPKVVVTLGRHSMNCFLPDLQISKVHGQPVERKGQVFMPLYHPAAALYNGSLRQTLFDDFARVTSVINHTENKS